MVHLTGSCANHNLNSFEGAILGIHKFMCAFDLDKPLGYNLSIRILYPSFLSYLA